MKPEVRTKHMLETDPDFIALRRFDFSLAKLQARYPDGCPDHVIAAALQTTEDDVRQRYARIILTLRKKMGVEIS